MKCWAKVAVIVLTAYLPTSALAMPAGQAWREGRKALLRGDIEDAARLLEAAHDEDPKPQHKLDLARALVRAGEPESALVLLEQIADVDGAKLEKAAAARLLKEIEPKLPRLSVSVTGPPPGAVRATLDGQLVDVTKLIFTSTGDHRLVLRAEGFRSEAHTFSAKAGELRSVSIAMARGAADEGSAAQGGGSLAWVPGAVSLSAGAIGLGLGATFGVLAMQETNAIRDRCDRGVCPPSTRDDLAHAALLGDASTGSFIAGGVASAAGVVLLVVMGGSSDAPEQSAFLPLIGPGTAGAVFRF